MEALAAEAAAHARMMVLSWDLLRGAGYGLSTREHSAFLVTDANGNLQLVKWPWEATPMRATYRGTIPAGTVAIVHTHPNALPNPSHGDRALASSARLAVSAANPT